MENNKKKRTKEEIGEAGEREKQKKKNSGVLSAWNVMMCYCG